MSQKNVPFESENITSFLQIRRFSSQLNPDELLWHQDYEPRWVWPLRLTDWQIQFDNELPQKLNGIVFIPPFIWHRLWKGTGDLDLHVSFIDPSSVEFQLLLKNLT